MVKGILDISMELKRIRETVLRVSVALSLLLVDFPLLGQGAASEEYRAKAKYLSNFPSFIEWPEDAWPTGKGPFLICVLGEFRFGTSLAEVTRGATVHEKRVEIKWVRKGQELHKCQILFVSESERTRYGQVLEALRGERVLTVGETTEFLEAGGVVSFSRRGEAIQFDVNLGEANRAHLKISSRMLALARCVVHAAEAAKS